MSRYETISWRDLPGNKWSKSLDPAMTTERGCITLGKVRHCHEPQGTMCNVVYDRGYLIQFLIRRFLIPISPLGREVVDELINEAWDELHGFAEEPVSTANVAS